MLGVLVIGLLLVVGLCAIPATLLLDTSSRSLSIDLGDDGVRRLQLSLRRTRRRLVAVLAGTVAVLGLGIVIDTLRPSLLGLSLALAPGTAAAVALLAYATWPIAGGSPAGPVSASLTRREPSGFVRPRTLLLLAASAVAYIGLLTVASAVAQPDDAGRMRAFGLTQGDLGSLATPFPGSFYGLPLAVVTLLLAAATYAGLRRLATAPAIATAPATEGAAEVDRRWREIGSRVIVRTAAATLLGYAGATSLVAGSAILRVADFSDNGGTPTPWVGVGWVVCVLGVASLLAGAAVAGSAVAAVFTLRPRTIRRDPAASGTRLP